ncbi:ABC transporter ATP-binding protein [Actibacterium sp. MT2.3-13A]|uniref:ABC transporter ATP-binding protein n=1 Tax=Actibacterium sp. MT2.3-13A TaxID=2828332 RepID=UPI001BA8994A|nr:ABC transporter ATP-binding protein [Actibacterium sp. MT2.3-13A]
MNDTILSLRGVNKRYGKTVPADDFSIDIERGEFFTMLGPSGSGKSTILRMIAGLEQPDSGQILFEGRDLTHAPPWERQLGMVFQQYAIFPHMNVQGNVAYGLRRSGLSKTEIDARVEELLDLVGLSGFAPRRVAQLSGGEQQRVAIARALAPRPAILLLDEPLSALDEKIRREMQAELRAIQQRTGTTFIYVTHDQEEALTMSDRIAVLNAGRYVQCDRPEAIFKRPRTPFVARFFRGCNVLEADLAPEGAAVLARLAGITLRVPGQIDAPRKGHLAIRGETILLGEEAAAGDLQLSAHLDSVTYRGLYSSYALRLADGQALAATHSQQPELTEGVEVAIGLRAADVVVLDEE